MKFYLLDHGIHSLDEWHHERVEVEASSAEAAARNHAANLNEAAGFNHDGAQCHVVVADDAAGRNAREIVVTLRIEERIDVTKTRAVVVPPQDESA